MMSDRSNSKRYMFGTALASVAMGGIPGLLQHAVGQQVTNANFGFEISGTSTVGSTGSGSKGALAPDAGTGTAFGVHTSTATVYSFPTGNGSAHAFSSNSFSPGDYYQFNVPTIGIQNIVVSFDQTGSSTGPSHFSLIAIDGSGSGTYTVSSYTVALATFSSSTTSSVPGVHMVYSLSSISALNNNSSVAFQLMDDDTVALNGGAVGTAGTDRVDNFMVFGDAVSQVPEPASLGLAAMGVSGLLLRRKPRCK